MLIRTRYADMSRHDVVCGARADVTDFSYMTLMDKSAVKHNMLKWGETLCAALVAGSVVHGNVPRYCLKSRVCNVYL